MEGRWGFWVALIVSLHGMRKPGLVLKFIGEALEFHFDCKFANLQFLKICSSLGGFVSA